MDTVTQAVLGATVAVAVTKAQSPRKAVVLGAILATLPDLDILLTYENPIELIVNHRTWSHSWLVQTLIAPILAYIFTRIIPLWNFKTTWLMVFLVLTTHSALDALTVFGTDLFWPFSESTIVGGSVYIIDPLYTILVLALFVQAVWKPKSPHLWRNSVVVLFLSSTYLLWGVIAKTQVEEKALSHLKSLGISTEQILVHTTPFNTLLWRILVLDEDTYYEAFSSVLDKDNNMDFKEYPRRHDLLGILGDSKSFKQLIKFNHGFYSISKDNNGSSTGIVMNDLRKGSEPIYTFRFKIGEWQDNNVREIKPIILDRPAIPKGYFNKIWQRIFDEKIRILSG